MPALLTDAQIATLIAAAPTHQNADNTWNVQVNSVWNRSYGNLVAVSSTDAQNQVQTILLADPTISQTAFNNTQTQQTNEQSLLSKANTALTNNITFLGQPAPTFPLTVAEQQALVNQVVALTRQVDALIHLAINLLTDTGGT